MDTSTGLIALVPAIVHTTADEQALLREVFGFPLIGHSFMLARESSEIMKIALVTNSQDFANKLEAYSRTKPFVLPELKPYPEAARPLLKQIAPLFEKREGDEVRFLLYLHPFYPFRRSENIMEIFQRMIINGLADAIETVSESSAGSTVPFYMERDGYLAPFEENGKKQKKFIKSRAFSLWRRDSLTQTQNESDTPWIMPYEIPEYANIPLVSPDADERVRHKLKDPTRHLPISL